jgi:myo-inositol catabolism protein IolC
MTILKNLQKVHTAVVVDTFKGAPLRLGDRIMKLALTAVEGGIGSDEWKDYMSLFADNAVQLARLRGTDGNNKDYLKQFRAYIVTNAMCDASTDTKTGFRVDERIDELIQDDQPDGTVTKPIEIPDPE